MFSKEIISFLDDLRKIIFWIVVTMKNTVFNNQKMNSASGLLLCETDDK